MTGFRMVALRPDGRVKPQARPSRTASRDQAMSIVRGGGRPGGRVRPAAICTRIATSPRRAVSRCAIEIDGGKSRLCARQAVVQLATAPSHKFGTPTWQSAVPISVVMTLACVISIAMECDTTTDKLIPSVRTAPKSKISVCRTGRNCMAGILPVLTARFKVAGGFVMRRL